MTAGCGFIRRLVAVNKLNRKQRTANFVIGLQAWELGEVDK
jgi:hypothetical protein